MTLKELKDYYCKINDKKMNRICILSRLIRIVSIALFIVSAILTVIGLIIRENGMTHTTISNIIGYTFIIMVVIMMLLLLLKQLFENYIETEIPPYISNQALHELTIGLPYKAWLEVWKHEKLEEIKNDNRGKKTRVKTLVDFCDYRRSRHT